METSESLGKDTLVSPPTEINIFNYTDYRQYLRDFYQLRKNRANNYSYASFSQRAGIKSPNYLKLVMDGQRKLSADMILAFAKGLGLNELETIYWENLVSFGQATSPTQRQFYLMRLSHTKFPAGMENTRMVREIRDELEYYSDWYHAAIREMVTLADFDPAPEAIAARLANRISPADAAASLALLQRLGFIETNEQGKLRQCQQHVRYGTRGDIANLMVRRFHRATAKLAFDCLEDNSDEAHQARHFNSLTIAVSRKTLPEIKARLGAYLRVYMVKIKGHPTERDLEFLKRGIFTAEGVVRVGFSSLRGGSYLFFIQAHALSSLSR